LGNGHRHRSAVQRVIIIVSGRCLIVRLGDFVEPRCRGDMPLSVVIFGELEVPVIEEQMAGSSFVCSVSLVFLDGPDRLSHRY